MGSDGGAVSALRGGPAAPVVPSPEAAALEEIAATLRAVDPDDLSPRAALDLVATLTKKLTTAAKD